MVCAVCNMSFLLSSMFHPQIIGKPGNMMLLDRLLRFMKKPKGVWFANAKQVAEHWNKVR